MRNKEIARNRFFIPREKIRRTGRASSSLFLRGTIFAKVRFFAELKVDSLVDMSRLNPNANRARVAIARRI